jgi:hypothetical protein
MREHIIEKDKYQKSIEWHEEESLAGVGKQVFIWR